MLGWEFPPYNVGGLGTACYGLTKALSALGLKIIFVVPKAPDEFDYDFLKVVNAGIDLEHLEQYIPINSGIVPYYESFPSTKILRNDIVKSKNFQLYGPHIFEEVNLFSDKVLNVANNFDFDLIHAHDWMTYPAAIKLKHKTGKPLILHIHATSFDRGVIGIDPRVYDIEKRGFEEADVIVAVSEFTMRTVIEKYGINPEKVKVVHNGVLLGNKDKFYDVKIFPNDYVVSFVGRITIQKGPLYFVEAAKIVSDFIPNVKFLVTGSGDMLPQMINRVAELGLSDKVVFTGFLRGKELDKIYAMSDVYVMPSVSEPFGITPLEAIANGTPVIISKQSGVSEVLRNCLKVDYWDVEKMANYIIAVLKYSELRDTLKTHAFMEITNINWDNAAKKLLGIYEEVLNGRG
ncbi:MAG: hypothetical protein PWR32_369 [Candidatus Woesearchaeota archaeon]|nr:hypothetical protein [Candidatus Woesearchaeota archaeon]